ncbi:hypothetical protein BDZ89DRAFT_719567 [Hymenopellis radicata]|nr:hypothetical protein BDZ89DRAFT_719567 [Hymenopellis radicata]
MTKVTDTQAVVFARDETIKDLAEKLRRAQTQIKRNLAELESFRRQATELEGTKRKLSGHEALTESLSSEKVRLEGEVAALQAKVSDFEIENMGGAELFRDLNAQVAALQADKDTLQTEKDSLTNRMFQDLETVVTERDALLADRDRLLSTVDNLKNEKDAWQVAKDSLENRSEDLALKTASLEEALKAEAEARKAERDAFIKDKNALLLRIYNIDMKATPALGNHGPLDSLRSENVTFPQEKLALQEQVPSIQTQYTELQKRYAELQEEKQELERTANREPSHNIPDPDIYQHQVVRQLQTDLAALQTRYDEGQNDKHALAARVATLQVQYDTLKEVLGARNAPLDGGRDADRRHASTRTSTDGAEMARLSEELERTTDQLATCKRKLDGARKHVASVRTSYQRKFVLEHVAVVHLYENLSAALESSSAEHLRKAVKTHVKELRKLKGRLKEETPASVDVIMGMIMKQEEEEDVGVLFDEDEDVEDGSQGGQGGDDSLDEDDQEENTRPRKRPRPNPPLRPPLSLRL